jgi:hypothetical protein
MIQIKTDVNVWIDGLSCFTFRYLPPDDTNGPRYSIVHVDDSRSDWKPTVLLYDFNARKITNWPDKERGLETMRACCVESIMKMHEVFEKHQQSIANLSAHEPFIVGFE